MEKLFHEQLRQAIRDSGWTGYAIAKATGIPQSQVSRFMNDKGGLQQSNIDKVFALLGLKVVGPDGKAGEPAKSKPRTK